jgi:oxygen-independent coproporphyrinogen-3 oxidase
MAGTVPAMSHTTRPIPPAVDAALLRKVDLAGPRYTSYPTADRFVDIFDARAYVDALRRRSIGADPGAPISVYVHLPFCESVCYFCACNKVVTKHHEQATEYLDVLEAEMALYGPYLPAGQPVSQLHLGGGSPTFLSDDELTRLMAALGRRFHFEADAELSIEVDPRTVTPQRLAHLQHLGFNRLSFGVQDFDPAVQEAVHRLQSYESVVALVNSARELGFESINVDLIHGLPHQTPQTLAHTLAQVSQLRPDRVALYAYAHLPQRFKPQRRIDASAIAPPQDRVRMLALAVDSLREQGYVYIGMDHFALPEDSLAVARREGGLHRNFQGYTTQADRDLIALGVSSIGRVADTYSQNAKALPEYYAAVRAGRFPVVRGVALSAEDRLRRDVIMAIMCQGRLDRAAIEKAYGIDMATHFASEFERLADFEAGGLLVRSPGSLQLTEPGWFFVRAIAMVFDQHLQAQRSREGYSRVI